MSHWIFLDQPSEATPMFLQKKPSSARAAKMTGRDFPKPKTPEVAEVLEIHIWNAKCGTEAHTSHTRIRFGHKKPSTPCGLGGYGYFASWLSAQTFARFATEGNLALKRTAGHRKG